jgi:hypothetical protein
LLRLLPCFGRIVNSRFALSIVSWQTFSLLVKYKPIASLAISLPNWIPTTNLNGKEMETNSFLGPFFRLSSCPPDVRASPPFS